MSNEYDFSQFVQTTAFDSGVAEKNQVMGEPLLNPLVGDAGFRRYFRVASHPKLIAADAGPEKVKNLEFVRVSHYLKNLGVRVPELYAVDLKQGFFLLEDLGDVSLQQAIDASTSADPVYQKAIDDLLSMQCASFLQSKPSWLQPYSSDMLLQEMQLCDVWFFGKMLGLQLTPQEQKMLSSFYNRVVEDVLQQPQVLVHRDYHCRNLMQIEDGSLAMIDFQDAVLGPVSYDLVSLIKDCYLRWPKAKISQTVVGYAEQLFSRGLLDQAQFDNFGQGFNAMGLQRHIKVFGVFARLSIRDDKKGYLNDLPLVLHYVMDALQQYPNAHELLSFYQKKIVTACEEQKWYQDWQTAGTEVVFEDADVK